MAEMQFFDDLDTLHAALRASTDAADARVVPWQATAHPGQGALLWSDELDEWMFVDILDATAGAADAEELAYLRQLYAEPDMVHYRFARVYSSCSPEGELGDIHVSQLACLLPAEAMDACRREHWCDFDDATIRTTLRPWQEAIERSSAT